MMQRFSEDDEIEAILKIAVRKESAFDGSMRERLLATAHELGISTEAALAAQKQWTTEQRLREDLADFGRVQWRDFYGHLAIYLAVNVLLVAIYLRGSGDNFWPMFPILGWGIGIVGHAVATFSTIRDPNSKDFQRWRRKEGRSRGGRRGRRLGVARTTALLPSSILRNLLENIDVRPVNGYF